MCVLSQQLQTLTAIDTVLSVNYLHLKNIYFFLLCCWMMNIATELFFFVFK